MLQVNILQQLMVQSLETDCLPLINHVTLVNLLLFCGSVSLSVKWDDDYSTFPIKLLRGLKEVKMQIGYRTVLMM